MKSQVAYFFCAIVHAVAAVFSLLVSLEAYFELFAGPVFSYEGGEFTWYEILTLLIFMLSGFVVFWWMAIVLVVLACAYAFHLSHDEVERMYYRNDDVLQLLRERNGKGFPWWLIDLHRKMLRHVFRVFAPKYL